MDLDKLKQQKHSRHQKYPAWFDELSEENRIYLIDSFQKAEKAFYDQTKKYKYHLIMPKATVDDMLEITEWCEENLPDCLPFPNDAIGKYKRRVFWCYFNTIEEKMLFRLRWI